MLTQISVFSIEPPHPIKNYFYFCDKKFHPEKIYDLYETQEENMMITVSGKETCIYIFNEIEVKLVKRKTVELQNHHRRGGQSQNRIQRLADESHFNYITQIVDTLKLLKLNNVKNIVLFGPASKKDDLCNRLPLELGSKVVAVETISGTESVAQLHARSLNYVKNVNAQEECKIVEQIYDLITEDRDELLVFGLEDIDKLSDSYQLRKIIVHRNCDYYDLVTSHAEKCEIIVVRQQTEQIERFLRDFEGLVGVKYFAM